VVVGVEVTLEMLVPPVVLVVVVLDMEALEDLVQQMRLLTVILLPFKVMLVVLVVAVRLDLLVVVVLVLLAATVPVMQAPLGAMDYQILLELVHLFSMLVVAVAVDHRAVQEETVVAEQVLEILPQ
tara:strand:+ start:474 stop:851 length:378 start_codon:yes stop_codon:yes gene_type:complete